MFIFEFIFLFYLYYYLCKFPMVCDKIVKIVKYNTVTNTENK